MSDPINLVPLADVARRLGLYPAQAKFLLDMGVLRARSQYQSGRYAFFLESDVPALEAEVKKWKAADAAGTTHAYFKQRHLEILAWEFPQQKALFLQVGEQNQKPQTENS